MPQQPNQPGLDALIIALRDQGRAGIRDALRLYGADPDNPDHLTGAVAMAQLTAALVAVAEEQDRYRPTAVLSGLLDTLNRLNQAEAPRDEEDEDDGTEGFQPYWERRNWLDY